MHNLEESTSKTELLDLGKTELELDCFTEELLLWFLLEDEFSDELDVSFLLLEESSDFTELELLESEEFFVSFTELLDTSAGSEPLKLLDELSLVSLPEDFLSTDDEDSSESDDSTD